MAQALTSQPAQGQQEQQQCTILQNPVYEWNPPPGHQAQHHTRGGARAKPSLAWAPSPESSPQPTRIDIQPLNDPANEFLESFLPRQQPGLLTRCRWALWLTNVLVLGHVLYTAYTDPIDSDNQTLLILLTCLSIILLLLIVMAFFVLTSQTLYVRLGRYDLYVRHFQLLYITFLAELLLMLATKAYYIALVVQNVSHVSFWRQPAYLPLWAVQRSILCLFWVVACYSTFQAMDAKLYDVDELLASH